MVVRILGLPFFAVHVSKLVIRRLAKKWAER
jgi:hypothetical protein